MIKRIWTLVRHWREAKSAFSTLSLLYGGGGEMDALGGLSEVEMDALCRWAGECGGGTVVEVGTLFGLTARELAVRGGGGRVVAVDNFSWNPFGLPRWAHRAFAERILKGSGVELVEAESGEFRERAGAGEFGRIGMVFFDADHRYEAVKAELEWAKAAGVGMICGHDYGNPRFGVTRAVDEVFGAENVEVAGMCWRWCRRVSVKKCLSHPIVPCEPFFKGDSPASN